MASKKGVIATIVILAAITAGSFLFWMIPQESKMELVVSDHENYLDGVKEIHAVLDQSISEEFQDLENGNISPEEYIKASDVISSQVTSQISEFVTSKPPVEWQESYIKYMESLQNFNSYVTETKVYAGLIKEGRTDKFSEEMEKLNSFKLESERLAKLSDDSRPK
jgi:type II secretory pathway component GspD/PulD (secretin)